MAVVTIPRPGTWAHPGALRERLDRAGVRSAIATALILTVAGLAGAVATSGSPSAPPAQAPAVQRTAGPSDGLVDCDRLTAADHDDCVALTTGDLLTGGDMWP
ncbi:hypothetical protein [Nocardia sp. alder85J]|uniref:hypothetical protein n=1 Tax=Nocardia sp. alder85J TaxID=2862949 RepID=UPI001CD4EEEF|nr:hypothetical protein [Nocardia sp. alder85J]MCX4091662.1 hypothetical protein [Nocardia sp. alder85J]